MNGAYLQEGDTWVQLAILESGEHPCDPGR
jgi:hypothetical protein